MSAAFWDSEEHIAVRSQVEGWKVTCCPTFSKPKAWHIHVYLSPMPRANNAGAPSKFLNVTSLTDWASHVEAGAVYGIVAAVMLHNRHCPSKHFLEIHRSYSSQNMEAFGTHKAQSWVSSGRKARKTLWGSSKGFKCHRTRLSPSNTRHEEGASGRKANPGNTLSLCRSKLEFGNESDRTLSRHPAQTAPPSYTKALVRST